MAELQAAHHLAQLLQVKVMVVEGPLTRTPADELLLVKLYATVMITVISTMVNGLRIPLNMTLISYLS